MNRFSDIEFFEIGTILKAHGFKGEVLIHFSEKFENLIKKELLFVLTNGIYVPFFIEEAYQKSNARLAIKFRGIDNEQAAEEYIDCKIFTENSNIINELTEEHLYWENYKVYNRKQYIGLVTDFLTMSANSLFEVFYEQEAKSVLIPYSEGLIETIDESKKEIYFNLPEDLLNIND
ncbi:MAG: ribosome maturation factor RimM [Bacteroidota bacterium]|nr:ribosome maturation factor RimM [Bacteroidota bacterium]